MGALGSSFTYADTAAVTQTLTRSALKADGTGVYDNDTKAAAGHKEFVTLTQEKFTATAPDGTKVPMIRNIWVIERKLSTEIVPCRKRIVETFPEADLSNITATRNRDKDFNALWTAMSNSDAKVEDLARGRAHIP